MYAEEESFPLPLTDVFVHGIVESDIESSYFPRDVSLYVCIISFGRSLLIVGN